MRQARSSQQDAVGKMAKDGEVVEAAAGVAAEAADKVPGSEVQVELQRGLGYSVRLSTRHDV